jgi:hypothetical protein
MRRTTRRCSRRRCASSEIRAILKVGFGSTAFPIYRGGAAKRQTVGPPSFAYRDSSYYKEPKMSRKQEIIVGLTEVRQHILDAISDLPSEKQDEIFLGTWSIKDLLAHLIGWDFTNIEAVTDIRAGQPPRVFQHWDPEWAAYNAELVRKYKHDNFSELLASVQESHAALIEFVRTVPAEDIEQDYGIRSPRGRNITVAWFLGFEIEDEGRHYQQIQEWLN